MRKLLLAVLGLVFVATTAFAQDKTISGRVTAQDDGSPLPGVNVVLKGTTTGTVTDGDGNYRLTIPQSGEVLTFSFIGFEAVDVNIGNQSTIDISLASETTQLGEVVVTAVGISREKASLGYGVTSISEDAIQGRQEADVARILRGKTTGVDITQTSGLSGSGTNVIIRGYSSITGTNQPLFVIDGIPFNSDTNTGDQGFGTGSATASSRFLDLDPNAITDITILKGLSATVLYGEAGRNGVILVTTKNGKGASAANKKTEVSFNQGVYRSEVANTPDYQDTFGNGFSAGFGWFFSNWGPAFADLAPSSYGNDFQGTTTVNGFEQVLITHPYDQAQYNDDFPEYIGAEYPYEPHPSVENFFEPGLSTNTSLSVSAPIGDNSSVSATYSFLNDEGFTPRLEDDDSRAGRTNYIDKHNFGLGFNTKLQNGFGVKASFNYVNTDRNTPITAPAFGGDGNGLFAAILFTPRSMDLMGLPFQSPIDGSNVYYRRGSPIQNPRWTLNNSGQKEDISRFFSSTEFSYEINDNFTALYRLSVDTYSQRNVRHIQRGGARVPDGEMRTFTLNVATIDHIYNFLYQFDLNESLSLDGVVGFNSRRETGRGTQTNSTNQFVYGLLTHQNFIEHNNGSGEQEENTYGIYATATLGYKSWLYLNLQGRNDWTSTLEQENRSLFYPSVSASFIPTDLESFGYSNVLNHLKIRVGYGTSAGYPNPYQTRNILGSATNVFVEPGGNILNTNTVSTRLGNPNLKPELHTELELGIESRLLDNRIGIDLSLYQKNSSDLIIDLPLDPATGFTNTTVNAAELENKGIELGLDITPVRGEVTYDMTWNFTRNISEVISIFEGIDRVQTAGFGNGLGNYAIPGEQYGVLYGSDFRKNDEGLYIVDNAGNYVSSGALNIIGNPNPNYTLSWINNLSWKGLSFGFMFQYIDGGDMFSSTVQALLARGNTVDTDVNRNIPLIMPNSVKQTGTDADGNPVLVPNDIQTYIGDSFFRAYFFSNEGGIFDATVIRLREVSLSYVLPKALLENTPFGTVAISLSGENLWYNAPNFPVGINFDPEISSTGVGNGRGFDFRTAPTAKKYGINLNLTF